MADHTLTALVARWRANTVVKPNDPIEIGRVLALDRCADELDAALRASGATDK